LALGMSAACAVRGGRGCAARWGCEASSMRDERNSRFRLLGAGFLAVLCGVVG
jgi:hypothetical protein